MGETQVADQTIRLPKDLLRDRVAIVTGGSRGIGRATVQRLAEAGAHVVVNYLSHDREAEAAVRSARELGVEALPVQGDVSRGDAVNLNGGSVLSG